MGTWMLTAKFVTRVLKIKIFFRAVCYIIYIKSGNSLVLKEFASEISDREKKKQQLWM